MEGNPAITIAVLVILIALSAYFSATETAFSSLNHIRLKNLADTNKRAALALRLSGDFSTLLSTILVGNNIVNILSTSLATVLFVNLLGGAGVTVSTIVMTVVVLIFGEISPKTLAKESPEAFAVFSAPMLRVLMVILTPVNWLFAQWKKLLGKLFKTGQSRGITEDELMTMVDEAEKEGAIDEEDKDLILNVMEFNDSRASEILTPRVDVLGVEKTDSFAKVADTFLESGYTRLPVYEGSLDKIVGVVHLRDFFEASRQKNQDLDAIITPVEFITTFAKISDLLKIFQQSKTHLAVVTDEYGGTVGIITMEDVLEELVGEIWDEHDEIVEEVTQNTDCSFTVSGSADIHRVFRTLGLEGEPASNTVNGWIMEQMGRLPQPGDSFTYGKACVTIRQVAHNRVESCTITLSPPAKGGEEDAQA